MIKRYNSQRKGFTFIEIVLVIGILGMLSLILYPDIHNAIEIRQLENEARDILTSMQRAKLQAVRTKLNHRVRFFYEEDDWFFQIEREESPDQWNLMPGFIRKVVSPKFVVTIDFPNQIVEFTSLGFITDFDNEHHSITLQSEKLRNYGQPDLREISVFAGGSVRYLESESE
jgi:prepilin-type N-terminal cleavage/methylation domain-containing protein